MLRPFWRNQRHSFDQRETYLATVESNSCEEMLTVTPSNLASVDLRPSHTLVSSMNFQDWIFSFHLLFAATLVGGLVMSWIVVVVLRSVDAAGTTLSLNRVAIVGAAAIVLGLMGTIALGIWVAILRPQFHPWDGWVIGAIVLWAVATAAVLRSFVEYRKPATKARELIASGMTGPSSELSTLNRTSTGLLLRALASAAVVLIVIDMIYKPGA